MTTAREWSQACYRASTEIFRYGGYAAIACAWIPAIVSPEASLDDALAAGLLALEMIVTAALFCGAVGLGIALSAKD